MTDLADGAAAPAVDTGAPIETAQVDIPQALGSQVPEAQGAAPSVDDALDRAMAKVEARAKAKEASAAEPKDKAAEPKPERIRSDDGKFAAGEGKDKHLTTTEPKPDPAKDTSPHREPPARFSNDAKAAWAETSEAVRAETHRAIRELETGYQKHKADAEAYAELREFSDLAKQHNTTIKAALSNYVGIERLLASDPIAGLERIIANLGMRAADGRSLTLHDIAAHVLGQSPDEQTARQNGTIQQMHAEIAALKQQVGGVTQTMQQAHQTATMDKVSAFASSHPRFDELAPDIAFFLTSGRTTDLSEAYALAERLNPAPATASPPPAAPAIPPLNPAGQKSIAGAPGGGGSNPAVRKGALPSIDEALDRALARAG